MAVLLSPERRTDQQVAGVVLVAYDSRHCSSGGVVTEFLERPV